MRLAQSRRLERWLKLKDQSETWIQRMLSTSSMVSPQIKCGEKYLRLGLKVHRKTSTWIVTVLIKDLKELKIEKTTLTTQIMDLSIQDLENREGTMDQVLKFNHKWIVQSKIIMIFVNIFKLSDVIARLEWYYQPTSSVLSINKSSKFLNKIWKIEIAPHWNFITLKCKTYLSVRIRVRSVRVILKLDGEVSNYVRKSLIKQLKFSQDISHFQLW